MKVSKLLNKKRIDGYATFLFIFGMLLDTLTTIFAMSRGHVELNPNWLQQKYWLFVCFMFLSFFKYIIFSESKIIKYIHLVFCAGFGLGWFTAGIHNIFMIIVWWGR